MSGDPSNASIWADADVYVGTLSAANPASESTAFSADWDLVGLLDGDAGFSLPRSEDVTDHFAWGGVLVRTSRAHFKLSVNFTMLEYSDVTRALIWPGSSAGELVVPRPERVKIAFETREDDVVYRLISQYQAEVTVVDGFDLKETELTRYPMMATIFPDGDGVLFVEQPTVTGS